ncbi:hypothetical protein [Winogradskyella algicola]|uniref:hypothetical protein n=1 Tax=Winogradskyella algicola TaxID=2575815 RepID=UPI00110962E5|nr:hypothetical protein [Winogradskyella algicola]
MIRPRYIQKHLSLLIGIILVFNCNSKSKGNSQKPSEEVIIDTVHEIKKHKIIAPKGNQIFENSEKLYKLKWENGYILKAINISECDNSNTDEGIYKFDKKIDSITFTNDSFTINFKAVENCCSEFLCEAEVINDATLNVIYNAYGSQCSCNCLFNMSFKFSYYNRLDDIKVPKTNIKNVVLNNNSNSKIKFDKIVR